LPPYTSIVSRCRDVAQLAHILPELCSYSGLVRGTKVLPDYGQLDASDIFQDNKVHVAALIVEQGVDGWDGHVAGVLLNEQHVLALLKMYVLSVFDGEMVPDANHERLARARHLPFRRKDLRHGGQRCWEELGWGEVG
jgi:hypothetical protein